VGVLIMQVLALAEHQARRWEPKRPPLRLSTSPPPFAHTGGKALPDVSRRVPWVDAITCLRQLASPAERSPTRPDHERSGLSPDRRNRFLVWLSGKHNMEDCRVPEARQLSIGQALELAINP
jgi:hypothetical protein